MSLISDVKTDVNMREVTFSISAEDLEAACERVYQRQKKDIAVKGFRKGKVPRKMVEKLYGEDVFYEDAVNQIIPASSIQSSARRRSPSSTVLPLSSFPAPRRRALSARQPSSPSRKSPSLSTRASTHR